MSQKVGWIDVLKFFFLDATSISVRECIRPSASLYVLMSVKNAVADIRKQDMVQTNRERASPSVGNFF